MQLNRNASEIKRLVHQRKEALHALCRFLISKGVAPFVAEEIITELSYEGKEIGNVKEVVSTKINVTGELGFKQRHQLALVGPTGVGKTTTIMKLADHYLKQGKNIGLATLDVSKKTFLNSWADKRNIPFFDTVFETEVDLLLIDTEGCNFYQPNRVDALGELLADCGEEIEVVLTLSTAAKEVDLFGAIHQFSSLCPSSLVFTKLDETLASGVLVNVCQKTDLPIRYIAHGFPLPGEIQLAHPELITHKILTDFNDEEFQFLRQLCTSIR